MAKIYGLFGSMTGKLADTVMSVRNGEQIARKYQPIVYNPSSAAQVAARAKLKLMSQLSAVMAPVIAIPRVGSVSSRNQFVKLNYKEATYSDDTAQVNVANIKITRSVVSLPELAIDRSGEAATVSLAVGASGLSRVVYAVFARQTDNSLRMVGSYVVTDGGADNVYGQSVSLGTTGEVYVLGYGVRDNTQAARAAFGNLEVLTGEEVAKLIVQRTLTDADITLTETRGLYSASSNRDIDPEDDDKKTKSSKK